MPALYISERPINPELDARFGSCQPARPKRIVKDNVEYQRTPVQKQEIEKGISGSRVKINPTRLFLSTAKILSIELQTDRLLRLPNQHDQFRTYLKIVLAVK